MSTRTVSTTALTVAGVAAVAGVVAYAVYFDHKRRTDVDFRKKLRKEKKKAEKTRAADLSASESAQGSSASVSADDLRTALAKLRAEELPESPEEKEGYFMMHVGLGEQLLTQGPLYRLPAALSFYRGLRVYPAPVELISIYQKTVPPPVFELIVQLSNLDTVELVEGYYPRFPPRAMNVEVKFVDAPNAAAGGEKKRRALVATRDFAAGEVIYQEQPVVAALDPDLEGAGTRCSHCLRAVPPRPRIGDPEDPLGSVYCSAECSERAEAQYRRLLFAPKPALPTELESAGGADNDASEPPMAERLAAQAAFVAFLKGDARERTVPHLLARYLARQVALETAKLLQGQLGAKVGVYKADLPDVPQYTLMDHIERLRFLDISVPDEENDMMRELLRTALPGLEAFLTGEQHATLKGKFMYNAIGITLPEPEDENVRAGRDDRPVSAEQPEDQEKTRTPAGTERQIGSGLYLVSAYLAHSCAPSVRPAFRDGSARLSLVAQRDLKAGDELTMAYVDVAQRPEEALDDARRRRRWALARGWRFACTCEKCLADGAPAVTAGAAEAGAGGAEEGAGGSEEGEPQMQDESKLTDVVRRAEGLV